MRGIGFAAHMATNYFRDGIGSVIGSQAVPAAQIVGFNRGTIPICSGGNRAARKVTCLVDGDTGWEHGVKWRLLSTPGCSSEYNTAIAARDRLQALMGAGYRIDWTGANGSYGRALVRITLSDGRDAGKVLLKEDLAQPWPN